MSAPAVVERKTSHGSYNDDKSPRDTALPVADFQDPNIGETDITALEDDSPYPEVRSAVANTDDPEMPVNTLRAWVLGIMWYVPTVLPKRGQILTFTAGRSLFLASTSSSSSGTPP